jgi:tRNA threonylcarbamoyl adenosine modification protein YeaZ
MQKLLCFDTTSSTTSVAIVVDGQSVFSKKAMVNYQAEDLLGLIDLVMKEAQHGLGDIDSVVVGAGPGSFTGIRTGIATARGLGASRNIKQLGIALPLAFAIEHSKPGSFVAPFIKANATECFVAVYYKTNENEIIDIVNIADDTSMAPISPLVEVAPIFVVPQSDVEQEVQKAVDHFVSKHQLVESGSSICRLDIAKEKERGHSAAVLGSAIFEIYQQTGNLQGPKSKIVKALDRFSLNKANPLYVKGVNAPTLAERQAGVS